MINSAGGESVQFSYNDRHERWRAVYTGSAGLETTYFAGDLLEKVITAGATDYRHYIYAGGAKIAVYSRTASGVNTLRYIREDHQGSIADIINSDGSIYVKESFTAFGIRRSACTWSGPPTQGVKDRINAVTRHGYTWQTALGEMGLNDMNGRIQDAVTGRFLSADPYVPNPGFTQAFNRYSYVLNNPLSMVDPSGFRPFCYTFISNTTVTLPKENGEGFAGAQAVQYVTYTYTFFNSVCLEVPDDNPGTWPTPGGPGSPGSSPTSPPPSDPPPTEKPPRKPTHDVRTPQKDQSHRYEIKTPTTCTPDDAFDALKAPGFSAPGAPAVTHDGVTYGISLWHVFTPNLIDQIVDTPSKTITNIALPGHAFLRQVTTQVVPMGTGSQINTVGTGSSGESRWRGIANDAAGYFLFGLRNFVIQTGCDAANGIPSAQ